MSTLRKNSRLFVIALTIPILGAKITPHAGVVQFVDMVDLGDIDSVKVLGGIAMKWNEMTIIQRILFVVGWLCAAIWLVLTILSETGVLESVSVIGNASMGVWCLSNSIQKGRIMKVLWWVLAAANFVLCFL